MHSDNIFLCLTNSIWNVTTNIKINISMELDNSTRTKEYKEKLKLACIWREHLWFNFTYIGNIMGRMISTYVTLLSSMRYGFLIYYQITVPVSHQ